MSFWGTLDLIALGLFVGNRILNKQIPFYHDIIEAKSLSLSFGAPLPSIFTYVSMILYISLLFSGILLLKHLKAGAILSYIQCPFRLLTLIPISLFFMILPIKYIFGQPPTETEPTFFHPSIIACLSLMLLSEIIKTTTVIKWHMTINRNA